MGRGTTTTTHERSRQAFTLVELLVVIAILAILAGLLVPVASRTLGRGRTTACQNNLRQLGAGMLIAAQDGFLDFGPGTLIPHGVLLTVDGAPWAFRWFAVLADDMGLTGRISPPEHALDLNESKPEIFWCPSADKDLVGWHYSNLSYGINFIASPDLKAGDSPMRLHNLRIQGDPIMPSRMGLIGDSEEGNNYGDVIFNTPVDEPGDRHQEGGNVVFADGHTEWGSIRDLKAKGGPYRPQH